MNTQTVSPATAQILADAGFPQPAPAPGQWWSNGENVIFIWKKWIDLSVEYLAVIEHLETPQPGINRFYDIEYFTGLVYLPTVGDILRELQNHKNYTYSIRLDGKTWLVERTFTSIGEFPTLASGHESEHEAAALAWLGLNKK